MQQAEKVNLLILAQEMESICRSSARKILGNTHYFLQVKYASNSQQPCWDFQVRANCN